MAKTPKVETFSPADMAREVKQIQSMAENISKTLKQGFDKSPDNLNKAWQQIPNEGPRRSPKSWFSDPLTLQYALGFKERRFSLTYEVLKKMAGQLGIVNAILNTRCNQVAAFCQPYRYSKNVGFVIKHKDPDHPTTSAETAFIKEIEQFMMSCGRAEKNPYSSVERDDLECLTRKVIRDSLIIDQLGVEIVPDKNGIPYEFIAVDGASIRLAADERNSLNQNMTQRDGFTPSSPGRFQMPNVSGNVGMTKYNESGDKIKYVQVLNGAIENVYSDKELAWGIRNPRSDLQIQGYGYCLHPDTRISTDQGLIKIKDLVGKEFKVCINNKTIDAISFKTEEKEVYELVMDDNRVIKASPEHRFYCVNEDGFFGWKQLKDIKPGDSIASDMTEYDCSMPSVSFETNYSGQAHNFKIENMGEDLAELMGWMAGDGSFTKTKNDQYDTSLIYSNDELDIAAKHKDVLIKYGITKGNLFHTEGQNVYTYRFRNKGFSEWLIENGMLLKGKHSGNNKCVPELIFRLPLKYRYAFLRGLFSADGHRSSGNTPFLGCTDNVLLADVQRLIQSCGMRSRWYPATIKKDFGKGLKTYSASKLYVYDKEKFYEKVGFIQPHKNLIPEHTQGTRADCVCETFARRVATGVKTLFSKTPQISRLKGLIKNPARWGVTRNWLETKVDYKEPDLYWNQNKVKEVIKTNTSVQMYDLSVFDDFHGFTVDGLVTHNSELEQCISIITGYMYAEQYNIRYFSQGTMAKGIMNFKGENWNPENLECVAEDTRVQTDKGTLEIKDIHKLQNEGEVFEFWNGYSFSPGETKHSGKKDTINFKVDTGLELTTSKLHRMFYVDQKTGELSEKFAEDIKVGDVLLQNDKFVSVNKEIELNKLIKQKYSLLGHRKSTLTVNNIPTDLWELIGWFVGDGYMDKKESQVLLFYDSNKDVEAMEKHQKTLDAFNIKYKFKKNYTMYTDVFGITRPQNMKTIIICDTRFNRFLLDIGCGKSRDKKVPRLLYSRNGVDRAAFIRGIFSADGYVSQHGYSIGIFSIYPQLNKDLQDLLNSLGVTTYRVAHSYGGRDQLFIKNRVQFVKHIGFIQTYKNDKIKAKTTEDREASDKIPLFVIKSLLNKLPKDLLLTKKEYKYVHAIIHSENYKDPPCVTSRKYWKEFLLKHNQEELVKILNYRFTSVEEITITGEKETYDVHIQPGYEPRFIANGILTHNSFKRDWIAMVSGIGNAHSIPVMQSEGAEYIDLLRTNTEMQFGQWLEYLLKNICAVYQIDPAEIGFDMGGGSNNAPLFESAEEWKLKASRDKGLKPLLKFYAKFLNKNIIDRIDDHFYLEFVGLDELSEQDKHEMLLSKVGSYLTLNEARRSEDLPDLPHGDSPLNPIYLQMVQAADQKAQQEKMDAQQQEQQAQQPQEAPPEDNQEQPSEDPQYSDNFGN